MEELEKKDVKASKPIENLTDIEQKLSENIEKIGFQNYSQVILTNQCQS